MSCDRPNKAEQFASYCRHHHRRLFACGREAAVTTAKTRLRLPCDRSNGIGCSILAIQKPTADASWQSVGPGGFDQDAARLGVAGLGNGAAANGLTARILRWRQTDESHQLAGVIETGNIADL